MKQVEWVILNTRNQSIGVQLKLMKINLLYHSIMNSYLYRTIKSHMEVSISGAGSGHHTGSIELSNKYYLGGTFDGVTSLQV